jgi:hypothetical protein
MVWKIIDLNTQQSADWAQKNFTALPTDSLVLLNARLDNVQHIPAAPFIFIDGSYDPVLMTDEEILALVEEVQQQHPNARVIFLSSNCGHFYTKHSQILWYPVFMLRKYNSINRPRSKRVGCLNRRNAPHRVWLMHNLLSNHLIDHARDIFSVSFANVYDNKVCDLSIWSPDLAQHNQAVAQYPSTMATMPDDFPNDHSIDHPAWATALTIVTETEVGDLALITEKTVKAIEAECCWILHTGPQQLNVMNDLGFNLIMFEQHATGVDIKPIVDMCRTLDTETVAMDYYHSFKHIIAHNKFWLEHGWLNRYLEKLNTVLY